MWIGWELIRLVGYAVSVLVVISDTAAWLTLVIARPLNGNKISIEVTSFIFEKIYSRTILVEFIENPPMKNVPFQRAADSTIVRSEISQMHYPKSIPPVISRGKFSFTELQSCTSFEPISCLQ